MKLGLEIIGGFVGPAAPQRFEVEVSELPPERARQLQAALAHLPDSIWGASFLAPHPKSSDFRYVLRRSEGGKERSVTFHLHQGPPELSEIARELMDIEDERKD